MGGLRPFSPFLAAYAVVAALIFVWLGSRVQSPLGAGALYAVPWLLILFLAWQRGYLDRR